MNARRPVSAKLKSRKTVSGDQLWKALEFNNLRAFQRARARGEIDVPLYPKPGTRGVYAFLEDIQKSKGAKKLPKDLSPNYGFKKQTITRSRENKMKTT